MVPAVVGAASEEEEEEAPGRAVVRGEDGLRAERVFLLFEEDTPMIAFGACGGRRGVAMREGVAPGGMCGGDGTRLGGGGAGLLGKGPMERNGGATGGKESEAVILCDIDIYSVIMSDLLSVCLNICIINSARAENR